MPHILVIDDDEFMRFSLCQILDEAGYETHEASNGKIGLKMCQELPIQLVITDLMMPEQEGLETITKLHTTAPHIKIIAMSGGGTLGLTQYIEVAKMLGAHYGFAKPLDLPVLLNAVSQLLTETAPPE